MKETQKPFALDQREKIVQEGDKVVFLHFVVETNDLKMCCATVMDVRIEEGSYEVNVAGPYGGWKRIFYKVEGD